MNVIGQTDNFQSYSYNNLGISLKKPIDWAFVSLKNGLQLIKEKDAVYLEIRKSNSQPSNTTLEQLALNAIQERFSSRKDFQVLNLSKTSISGNLPAYKAVYEFLKTPNENPPTNEGTTNKVLRITTFANGVPYIVKYVSEKNKYDSYLPIAEKIIHSLKFNVQEKSPKGYVQCLDNGNIPPCIGENGDLELYCDDPTFKNSTATACMPSPEEWAKFLPSCTTVNFQSSCTRNGVLMWSCDDPEFNFIKYPQGCMNPKDNVKPKSDNNNNNNNNHKSTNLKQCNGGENPPPCILGDNSIGYSCKDPLHFQSDGNQCLFWDEKNNGWGLRIDMKDNSTINKGGKITVGYGDVGSYYGKGKVVIKNLHTGETLVTEDLNFAKQHNNQGSNCCVKVYTFDDSKTHSGDTISAKVTGGGGSWESGPYTYKNNLRMSITLDEIGEDVEGNKLIDCNSGENPPPCILGDNSIGYSCKDSRHFQSDGNQCLFWDSKHNGWGLKIDLPDYNGDKNNNDDHQKKSNNNNNNNNNGNNNDNKKDNGCPKSGFGSDADFCGDFGDSNDNNNNDDSGNYGNDYNYNNDGNLTAYYNVPQIIGIT